MTIHTAASAPGKIILSGEHFVVHGSYSVAAAISKRVLVSVREIDGPRSRVVSNDLVSNLNSDDGMFPALKSVARNALSFQSKKGKVSLEISVNSEIPSGSGLGSSAAVSVACAAALSDFLGNSLDMKEISKLAFQGEKAVHGNPSGLDIQASLMGGLILFKKNFEAELIPVASPVNLLVVFSGRKRSTSKLISKVAQKMQDYPNYFQRLVANASKISFDVARAAKTGDYQKMGFLFSEVQNQLSWIGVSTNRMEDLIEYLYEKESVMGVKITGAGGGGSVIAAVESGAEAKILEFASARYPVSFITQIPQDGLRWEKTKN
jgi:mevalonate kinase